MSIVPKEEPLDPNAIVPDVTADRSTSDLFDTGAPETLDELNSRAVDAVLARIDDENMPDPILVTREVIAQTNTLIKSHNSTSERGDRFRSATELHFTQLAQIVLTMETVKLLSPNRSFDPALDRPMIWDPDAGIYRVGHEALFSVAQKYAPSFTSAALREFARVVSSGVERVMEYRGTEWIPVANGDFNYLTKQLHPYSADRTFLNRPPHDYREAPANPVLTHEDGTSWDVESWMLEMACGDEELCELLWQVIAAAARSNHPWDKAIALYDKNGLNGKGTLLKLIRELVGDANNLSAGIASLGQPTTLQSIFGKRIITSDENDVNAFIRSAEVIKTLITREPIFINPKYEKPYNYTFPGLMIHCLNELLVTADKTESFWRRWVMVPLKAQFKGRQRKYIKGDYVGRPEVLEYVLHRVLHMDFDSFSETEATRALLGEAKLHNDPLRAFWDEHKYSFHWTMLPLEFLYDIYKPWRERNNPAGQSISRKNFDEGIRTAVNGDHESGWIDHGKGKTKRPGLQMSQHEPLTDGVEAGSKWSGRRTVQSNAPISNVLYQHDPDAYSTARLKSGLPSVSDDELAELRQNFADAEAAEDADINRWQQRAVTDDNVTDATHVSAHARIRRMNTKCACGLNAGTYDLGVEKTTARINEAFKNAESSLEDALEDSLAEARLTGSV